MKPLARYASLNGYLDLCRSVAIDPVPLMRGAGLDPAGLGLQDRWVPAAALAKVLEDSAAQSGYEDFGLRMAERRQFANLGPLSLVVREEPDVRKAMGILSRYQHMYNEVLRTRLDEVNEVATIRIHADFGEPVRDRQFIELAVAVTHRLLTGFLGARWRPLAVCFTHGPPTKMGIHRQLFGPAVNFDHEFSGIVLVSSDLDTPNRMSDPGLQPYAQQILDSFGTPADVTLCDRVREIDRTPASHGQVFGRSGRPQPRIGPPYRPLPPRPDRPVVLVDTEFGAYRTRRPPGRKLGAHVQRDRRHLVLLGAEQLLPVVPRPIRLQSEGVAGPARATAARFTER